MVKLSDRFFNLFLQVEADLDQEGKLKIKQVELKDFEQKGLMNDERMASYQGLSGLGLDLKMTDNKQELELKIRELEKQLEELEEQSL